MISSKRDRSVCIFCNASGEQPNASMTHSTPFMHGTLRAHPLQKVQRVGHPSLISIVEVGSRLRLAAFRAELCRARNLFAALGAELGRCASGATGGWGRLLRRR